MSKKRATLLTEFHTLWDSSRSNLPVEGQIESYPWIPNYGECLEEYEQKERRQSVHHLDPHLFIYEVALEWLLVFHLALEELTEKGFEWAKVPSLLTANAHIYGVAIHRLIVSGLDSPARVLLRSLIEVIDLCLVTIDDYSLGKEWTSCEDSAESNDFWFRNLRSKKMAKKIEAICIRLVPKEFSGSKEFKEIMEWRSSIQRDHSENVHMTSAAASCTCYTPSFHGKDEFIKSLTGKVSDLSKRPLKEGSGFIMLFAQMAIAVFTEKSGNPLSEVSNDIKSTLLISKEVLMKFVIQNWD